MSAVACKCRAVFLESDGVSVVQAINSADPSAPVPVAAQPPAQYVVTHTATGCTVLGAGTVIA